MLHSSSEIEMPIDNNEHFQSLKRVYQEARKARASNWLPSPLELEPKTPEEKAYRDKLPLTNRNFPFGDLSDQSKSGLEKLCKFSLPSIKSVDVLSWAILFNQQQGDIPRLADVGPGFKTNRKRSNLIRSLKKLNEIPFLLEAAQSRAALLKTVDPQNEGEGEAEAFTNLRRILEILKFVPSKDIEAVERAINRKPARGVASAWRRIEATRRGPRGDRARRLLVSRLRDLLCFWNAEKDPLYGSTLIETILSLFGTSSSLANIDRTLQEEPVSQLDWLWRGLRIGDWPSPQGIEKSSLVSLWPYPMIEIQLPSWNTRVVSS